MIHAMTSSNATESHRMLDGVSIATRQPFAILLHNALLSGIMVTTLFCGCSTKTVDLPVAQSSEVVYFCRETKKFSRAPRAELPAENPITGRKTLQLALYCERCKKWYPVPSADTFSGNPLSYRCPKTNNPMSQDGPLPR